MTTPTATEPSVLHHTFVIERTFPQPPATVFHALADPDQKRRWYGEAPGRGLEEFSMDFRVGGFERNRNRMSEATPFPGVLLTNEGIYLDIVPNRRIVTASGMALGGHRISATLVTMELEPHEGGTKLIFTHQGVFFEGADGPEMRQAGWNHILDCLAGHLDG